MRQIKKFVDDNNLQDFIDRRPPKRQKVDIVRSSTGTAGSNGTESAVSLVYDEEFDNADIDFTAIDMP